MSRRARKLAVAALPTAVIVSWYSVQLVDAAAQRPPRDRRGVVKQPQEPQRPTPQTVYRDSWATVSDGGANVTFQNISIPVGFFGLECDGFDGRVEFVGSPLDSDHTGAVDTVLERAADPIDEDDPVGTTRSVWLRLTELSLVSKDSIAVECDGAATYWTVHVTLSPTPAPAGSLTATKTQDEGGTFDSTIYVQPLLTFTNVYDPQEVLVFDTAGVSEPVTLVATNVPFVVRTPPDPRAQPKGMDELSEGRGFVPGVAPAPEDSSKSPGDEREGGPQESRKVPREPEPGRVATTHRAPDHQHCVEPTGACCFSSGSCAITTASGCAGVYLGDGSSCGSTRACCFGNDCETFDNVCCPVYGGSVPGASDCGPPDPCAKVVPDVFPSTATILVEIDPGVWPPEPDGFLDTVVVSSVGVSDTVVNRTAPPYADDVAIETEIVNLVLRGVGQDLGQVEVRARADAASTGGICNVTTIGEEFASGDSYFNVFVELEVLDSGLIFDTGAEPVFLQAEYIIELPPFDYGYVPAPTGGGLCEQLGGPQEITLFERDSGEPVGAILHTRHDVHSCLVKIDDCRDLCVDEDFTFSATGRPAGGTYSWSVSQPGNQLTPTSGTGQTFPVTAVEPSQTVGDVEVTVTYTAPGGAACQDVCRLTVLKVDLDIDSSNNGSIEAEDDDIELGQPGKLIYLNQDDDNKNDDKDLDENTAAVTDENDLQPINLSYAPLALSEGEFVLSAPTGSARVQVWPSPTKGAAGDLIALPKTWVVGTDPVPATLYVEGIDTGAVTLKFAYVVGGGEVVADKVMAGVVGIDLLERADTSYGYDDGTVDDNPVPTSADNPPQKYDWASVDGSNKTTDVNVQITPATYATHVHFVSSDTGKVTVSPANATASPQKLTLTGKAVSKPYVLTRLGTTSGAEGARLNVACYTASSVNANFYKVQATGLVPDGTTATQFENGANSYMKRGVSSISLTDNGTTTIEYDTNGNDHLDIDESQPDLGAEWKAITDVLGGVAGKKVLHLSDSIWFDPTGSDSATGMRWGDWIVVTDASPDKIRTLAHETLHNLGLADTGPPGKNTANIMYYASSTTKYFVGYFKVEKVATGTGGSTGTYEIQWDTITR